MVSAGLGEFEAGICKEGMARLELGLCGTLGIRNLIIVINKMD